MSDAVKEVTKCSKLKGEFCRLHNPAPSTGMRTVDDVFKKVSQESQESKARKTVSVPVKNRYGFKPIAEPRTLPDNIPMLVKEHEQLSLEMLSHLTDEEKLALKGYTGFAAAVCNNVLQGKNYEYYDEAPLWKESTGPCDFVNRDDLISYFETMDKVLENRHLERRTIYRGIPIYASLHDEIGASIGKKLHVEDTDGLVEGLKEYYKPGKVFNNKTYWSSTSSAYLAADRAGNTFGTKQNYWEKAEISGIVFELHTNAGLDITGARTRTSFEREVLLPRDTYFKVVDVHVKPEEYKTISGYDNRRHPEELVHENFKSLAVVVQMVEVDKNGNEITHSNNHVPSDKPESFVPNPTNNQ